MEGATISVLICARSVSYDYVTKVGLLKLWNVVYVEAIVTQFTDKKVVPM